MLELNKLYNMDCITQKTVALYHWILRKYANPGGKILDTHAGSASSFVAAYDMGFDYIGFEKSGTE